MLKSVEKTLVEQMRITEFDIEQRKALFGLLPADIDALLRYAPLAENEIDRLVNDFYATQTSIPEIALLIGDADTLSRMQEAQRTYILDLFGGTYGLDYVNNRLRIGLVHKRIGVEPKLYLSAILMLRTLLTEAIRRSPLGEPVSGQAVMALEKLIFFDVALVFETYTRSLVLEIESAKKKAEEYAYELERQVSERTGQLRIDPLTGTYNRLFLVDTLQNALRTARQRAQALTLLFVDIDNFKFINDNFGHIHGDAVLRGVGEILRMVSRNDDRCFRYGGDEFCVILPNTDERQATTGYVNRARPLIEQRLGPVTVSIGMAQAGPQQYEDAEALLRRADENMYLQKLASRDAGDAQCAVVRDIHAR